jgi:acyl-CoA hydrolase
MIAVAGQRCNPHARRGKAIIALPSTARGGSVSRIVPALAPGFGVVTTRGHVRRVVTDFGAVNLHGRSTPAESSDRT